MQSEKYRWINISIKDNDPLFRQVRQLAAKLDVSMSEMTRRALREFVEKNGENGNVHQQRSN